MAEMARADAMAKGDQTNTDETDNCQGNESPSCA